MLAGHVVHVLLVPIASVRERDRWRLTHANLVELSDRGLDQPVFQIQDSVARRWQIPPTVESSARRYLEDLRLIQREGPYQLIGYSSAG
jgi:thioesterase domain-containing protein